MPASDRFKVGQSVWVVRIVTWVSPHKGEGGRRLEVEEWLFLAADEETAAVVSVGWGIGGNHTEFIPRGRVFATKEMADAFKASEDVKHAR